MEAGCEKTAKAEVVFSKDGASRSLTSAFSFKNEHIPSWVGEPRGNSMEKEGDIANPIFGKWGVTLFD